MKVKKFLAVLLALTLVIALVGCSSEEAEKDVVTIYYSN